MVLARGSPCPLMFLLVDVLLHVAAPLHLSVQELWSCRPQKLSWLLTVGNVGWGRGPHGAAYGPRRQVQVVFRHVL